MRRSASKDDSTKRAPTLWYAGDEDEAKTETSVDRSRQPLYGRGGDNASLTLSASSDVKVVNASRSNQSVVPGHASSHLPRDTTTSITLAQFVQSYSDLLPAEIIVVEGANTPPVALSDKDILKVDRFKEHLIVLARGNNNQQYLIPFNAAIEFCVLYDPESNTSKALSGYTFEKVSDIISAEVKPKLVCARSSWEDSRTGTVVVTNREVFAVGRKVLSARRQRKSIKMYSITKHVTKELPEDCVAHFSTKPSLLPLYLAEIMEYVKSPFPCKAVLHDEGLVVPPHFSSLVRDQSGLILNLVSVDKGLVMEATYNRQGMESPVVMEIPVDLPLVKVKVLQCSSERRCAGHNRMKDASDCFDGNLQYHNQGEEEEEEDEEGEDDGEEEESTEEKSGEYLERFFKAFLRADATDTEVLLSCVQHSIDPKIQAAPISPGQFIEQYSHCLPAYVKVVESTLTTGSGIRVNEIYNVHFVTGAGGISMIDDKGFLVLVSTDSSTQFGIVYNPHKDLNGAVKGYSFESVDDVVRATLLPRVLCACETYKSSNPSSSVEAGEVLIVQKVVIGLQPKTSALTVYNIRDGTTKNLQSDCKGYFSTDPSRIQLNVSAILQHVPSVLPTVAMMYLAGQGCGAIISEPTKVTLLQHHAKPCLVSTTAPSSGRDRDQHQFVEIPLDSSVRMMVLRANFRHDATSTAKTNHADVLVTPAETHRVALLNVAKGYDVIPLPYNSAAGGGQNAAYRPVAFANRTAGAQRSKRPRSKGCPNPSGSNQQEGIILSRSVKGVPHASRYETLSRSVVDLTERLTALAEKVASVEGKLDEHVSACRCNARGRIRTADDNKTRGDTISAKTAEQQFVESLTTKEVLRLLDVSGLGAYSESFEREKIDGHLLCMLDDTLLQRDLNVSSALHRLKLLGIISGAVDVRSWMAAARPARNTTV